MSLRFGAFLAPHHLMGESPTLQLQRDLDLVEHLDRLGYDEFWCGEHHSTGWETIASPEMFLAAAAVRTHRIGLGTGVTSIPYHHPFHVAQKIVQLDHMSRGRALLGTGPGALPSDAHTLGIDPMVLRDRQDEAIPVIQRLLAGAERFSYESEWFTLRDAALQILPYQRDVHMTTASMVSPSGMTLAGKHGLGVLSLGSMSTAGLASLPLQWSFAEEAAEQSGRVVDRANWRIVFSSHVAETREQARAEVEHGLLRWHNEYNVGTLQRPGLNAFASTAEAIEFHANPESSAGVIGTPDDLIANIRRMQDITGGFGMVLNFAHDWANPEASNRSWDLIARHVIPEINGQIEPMRASNAWVSENRESFTRAGEAIMSKIAANARAVAALADAGVGSQSITPHVSLDDDPTAVS
ncbi:MAG: LLM class flavin-dependent oxidoreductase [Acidimicrobiaceae bacterium]|jgi:limonene 1,2-monooxygenase|nr:LLM class flavin-dependent oxidoreductase [Acidimicrobiaceae bacterium]MBT5849291.1 LLM class flavin-dependent oxidoreductase [Acidimicrobiaceae bacterium]